MSKLLASQGDERRVRVGEPEVGALATGALLAPDNAIVLGPGVDTWLDGVTADGQTSASLAGAAEDGAET